MSGMYPAVTYDGKVVTSGYPDNNPKTAIGATKIPLHLVPPVAMHYTAMAFADGAKKYGPYNWREKRVSSSVYVGAAMRHLSAYWDGEDLSEDAKVHHLGHVMACCAIILDGMSVGMLNDDRPVKGAAGKLQAEYSDKDKNDGQIFTYPVPTGNCEESLLPMEGRPEPTRDVGGDSRSVHEVRCRDGDLFVWESGGFRAL